MCTGHLQLPRVRRELPCGDGSSSTVPKQGRQGGAAARALSQRPEGTIDLGMHTRQWLYHRMVSSPHRKACRRGRDRSCCRAPCHQPTFRCVLAPDGCPYSSVGHDGLLRAGVARCRSRPTTRSGARGGACVAGRRAGALPAGTRRNVPSGALCADRGHLRDVGSVSVRQGGMNRAYRHGQVTFCLAIDPSSLHCTPAGVSGGVLGSLAPLSGHSSDESIRTCRTCPSGE